MVEREAKPDFMVEREAKPDFMVEDIDDTITNNIIDQPVKEPVKKVEPMREIALEATAAQQVKQVKQAQVANPIELSSVLSETVIIEHPHRYFSRIEPQEKKWWHFKFRSATDEQRFTQQLAQINLTATYNYEGQKNPDVTLTQQGKEVGKIHFLHFDRRDKGTISKYYIKLFLFQFSDSAKLEAVKQVIYDFFSTMSIPHSLKKHSKKRSTKRNKRSTKRSTKRQNKSASKK
jgi:hypothetical protein